MATVTVVHVTPRRNFPIIKATGLIYIPQIPPSPDDLDWLCDKVAQMDGLSNSQRRRGAIWACLPGWTDTIDYFATGMEPTAGLADIRGPDATGIIAFDIDSETSYAYNFEPLWELDDENYVKVARQYWRSARPINSLIGKPEPYPGNSEVLIPGPVSPFRLRTYYTMQDFRRDPHNKVA